MINYPLSSDTWNQKELDAIQRVVDSNRYTMGTEVKKYEQQFAEFLLRTVEIMYWIELFSYRKNDEY